MPSAHTRTNNIELTDTEREELVSMARSRSLPAALALRSRIVLACDGQGKLSTQVAKDLGIDRNTVNKWRTRYARDRLPGLYDELRPGRPRTVDDERVAELIKKTHTPSLQTARPTGALADLPARRASARAPWPATSSCSN